MRLKRTIDKKIEFLILLNRIKMKKWNVSILIVFNTLLSMGVMLLSCKRSSLLVLPSSDSIKPAVLQFDRMPMRFGVEN